MIRLLIAVLIMAPAVAKADVLAYWRFEEGTADIAASGAGSILDSAGSFHGTPFGGPFYRGDVAVSPIPQTGSSNDLSLQFINGSNDYVGIADPTGALNPSAITVELWMKADPGTQPGPQSLLVDHSHGWTDLTGWALQANSSNTAIGFVIGDGSTFQQALSTTNVFDGEWHHIAGTFSTADAGQEIKIYIDGTLENTSSISALVGNTRDVNIGVSWGGGSRLRYYNGLIDEVRISNSQLQPSEFLNVPEPASLFLLSIAAIGLAICRQRRD